MSNLSHLSQIDHLMYIVLIQDHLFDELFFGKRSHFIIKSFLYIERRVYDIIFDYYLLRLVLSSPFSSFLNSFFFSRTVHFYDVIFLKMQYIYFMNQIKMMKI